MASLSLKHIYKVYSNGTKAVNDFNMEIKDKEFIVFVGPSGCGKSTTLRMIAGLEEITYGELSIGDEVVNSLEPKERDIAMVFQNYALYPHMSIYENIAFGLRTRKIPNDEIDKKVKEVAKTLEIEEYLDKKPKEMSGGQRQRVALGRAIVREPKVMLLDEPLSNLDAMLRTQMRSEIVKLHKKLNTTFIYVTHDQVEAMTMGSRIVVMKDGYVKQIDTPKNLYRYPNNMFVASFIGTPQMNFFRVKLNKINEQINIIFLDINEVITVPFSKLIKVHPSYLDGSTELFLGIRAENIALKKSESSLKMKISHIEELGNESLIYGDIDLNNDSIGISPTKIIVKTQGVSYIESEPVVDISFDLDYIHLFDSESKDSILKRIPDNNYVNISVKNNKLILYGIEFDLPSAFSLVDYEYEALIPLSAIKTKKGSTLVPINKEKIDDIILLTLKKEDHTLFALSDNIYDNYDIDIDMSLITIMKNGIDIIKPIIKDNIIQGRFDVRKVNDGLFKNHNEYYISFLGNSFASPQKITQKMCQAYSDRRIFREEFSFSFPPHSIKIANDGIEGKVIEEMDFGCKRYVLVQVKDEKLLVLDPIVKIGDNVFISFNFDEMSVTENERDIKVI